MKHQLLLNPFLVKGDIKSALQLPEPVDPASGKSNFKNGILEISFKLKNSKEHGIPIDVG